MAVPSKLIPTAIRRRKEIRRRLNEFVNFRVERTTDDFTPEQVDSPADNICFLAGTEMVVNDFGLAVVIQT